VSYPIAVAIQTKLLILRTLQKDLTMKTVPLTAEQLDHLLTVLDYVLTTEATSYEEWCDMGNNPEQHVWFYAADAVNALSGETA